MQKLSVWLSIAAVALGVVMEVLVFYKSTQETIINKNKIREGHATAESAEMTAKINANNIAKSAAEVRKLSADAQSAGYLAQINQNTIAKSAAEARKVKADAEGAGYLATINEYNVETKKRRRTPQLSGLSSQSRPIAATMIRAASPHANTIMR